MSAAPMNMMLANLVPADADPGVAPRHAAGSSPRPGNEQASLHEFDTVFCDSMQALEAAYAQGLPRTATILTRAPALLIRKDLPVLDLDGRRRIDDAALSRFYFTRDEFLKRCLAALEQNKATAPLARLTCRTLWQFEQTALCAIFLAPEDIKQPRLVIEADLADKALAGRLRFPWADLLSGNPRCRTFKARVELPGADRRGLQEESKFRRFRVRGLGHLVWRLAEKFGHFQPISRGTFYSIKENELVRDAAVAFFMRGYRISRLRLASSLRRHDDEHATVQPAIDILRGPLSQRLAELVPDFAFEPLLGKLRQRLSRDAHAYDDAGAWLAANPGLLRSGRTVIMTNYPSGGEMVALAEHAACEGAVFAGAQHGITREIVDRPHDVVYENMIAPCFLSMTREGAKVTQQNAFAMPNSAVKMVGLPADYRRTMPVSKRRAQAGHPPIVYVQLMASVGSSFNGVIYHNDVDTFRRECRLLKDVFEGLNHTVLFKPYPNIRYVDEEPILQVARGIANIRVDATGVDMRFLLARHRVVITSGATSTVSWCIGSGVPVVYVDPARDGLRLSRDVCAIVQSSLFYFDERSPSFHGDLRAFLNQPIEAIEALWQERQSERWRLADYFGESSKPGPAAYRWLSAELRARRKSMPGRNEGVSA